MSRYAGVSDCQLRADSETLARVLRNQSFARKPSFIRWRARLIVTIAAVLTQ